MTADPTAALRLLAATAVEASSPAEITDVLVGAAHGLLEVDAIHVAEISQDRTVAQARGYRYTAEGRGGVEEYTQVIDERPSGVGRVLETGETFHAPDADSSASVRRDYVALYTVASALYVPVRWGGEVRWVLIALSSTPRAFADHEIALAETLADIAGAGLALIEAGERRAAQGHRDAALIRAAAALNAGRPRDETLEALTREADLAVGGDLSGIYLGDADSGGRATAGHQSPDGWLGFVIAPGEGVGGQVLATGQAVITNAYQSEVRVPSNPGMQQIQTAVSVPVRDAEKLIGALSVAFKRMRRVAQEDLETLQAIADLAAVAVRRG